MNDLITFFQTPQGRTAAGLVLFILLTAAVILFRAVGIIRFRRRLREAADNNAEISRLKSLYTDRFLNSQSAFIEKIALNSNSAIPALLDLEEQWLENLRHRGTPEQIKRILRFCPDKGLFTCFTKALDHPRAAAILHEWLEEAGDFQVLRRIPLSAPGQVFDTKKGMALFEDRKNELREMAGDPEWAARYFAISLLLEDDEDRSRRIVKESVADAHPLIRKTAVSRYQLIESDSRDNFYEELFSLIKTDPVREVRMEARARIQRDFADLYTVDFDTLKEEESVHFLEILDAGSKEDENKARDFLREDNLEQRFLAALFLEKTGVLEELFLQAQIGDQEMLERNYLLLSHACSVQIDSFLQAITKTNNPGSLLLAARLLPHYGNRELITPLAEKVLHLTAENQQEQGFLEIYNNTITAIVDRGTDQALRVLNDEMLRRPGDKDFLELLLPALPRRGDSRFINTLIQFLKTPDFPAREVLEQTLSSLPDALVLPEVMEILRSSRRAHDHRVRISALRILGRMKHPYCLQTILENLPTLPLEEARRFTELLQNFNSKVFEERTARLLSGHDAHVRAALIAALPATGKKSFLKEIKGGLEDADPDVRIACLWALLDYQEIKNAAQVAEMLRDPVERVRIEAARALGRQGNTKSLDVLETVLKDSHEVRSVKTAALQGLSASPEKKALALAAEFMETTEDLLDESLEALKERKDKASMENLIESFKDSTPEIRDRYALLFRRMGEEGERQMVTLLREDLPSLRPIIAEILESTGFIEAQIRMLADRDVKRRREAAEILALMDSASAFRGIVTAARDPDQEIRVLVTRALEKLASPEGKAVLQQLEEDPDKRIRKYTHWALERYRARAL